MYYKDIYLCSNHCYGNVDQRNICSYPDRRFLFNLPVGQNVIHGKKEALVQLHREFLNQHLNKPAQETENKCLKKICQFPACDITFKLS